MKRQLTLTLALGTALAIGAMTITPATGIVAECSLRQSTNAAASSCPPSFFPSIGFEPVRLPKRKMAPISIGFDGALKTIAGLQPPALKETVIDFDKNGTVDAAGLPVCKRSQLETFGIKTARRVCRGSIIGTGEAHVAIESSEQAPLALALTLFNGGVKDGTTTLFIHSYLAGPTSAPVVAIVKLRKIHEGRFGMQAISKIPRLADGRGSLIDFNFAIKRLFASRGSIHKYAAARCSDGHLETRATSTFANGLEFVSNLVRPCTPKG